MLKANPYLADWGRKKENHRHAFYLCIYINKVLLMFFGLFICFQDIDECSSNPCLNGGSCIDHVNGYTCNCLVGYTGIHCQTGTRMIWKLGITYFYLTQVTSSYRPGATFTFTTIHNIMYYLSIDTSSIRRKNTVVFMIWKLSSSSSSTLSSSSSSSSLSLSSLPASKRPPPLLGRTGEENAKTVKKADADLKTDLTNSKASRWTP